MEPVLIIDREYLPIPLKETILTFLSSFCRHFKRRLSTIVWSVDDCGLITQGCSNWQRSTDSQRAILELSCWRNVGLIWGIVLWYNRLCVIINIKQKPVGKHRTWQTPIRESEEIIKAYAKSIWILHTSALRGVEQTAATTIWVFLQWQAQWVHILIFIKWLFYKALFFLSPGILCEGALFQKPGSL